MPSNLAIPATVVPSGVALGSSGTQGGAGPVGAGGPRLVSADSGNTTRLGSDSLVYVPTTALATSSLNGALNQVSGSIRDLQDGTNNDREIEQAVTFRKRYYYAWHCDHPLGTNQTSAVSGTGASIGPVASEANHPGIYNLVNGTTVNNYVYYASSTVADIQLGFFTKLAIRFVVKIDANPLSAPDFVVWNFGLTDNLTTYSYGANSILCSYDPAYFGIWSMNALRTVSGGTKTDTKSNYYMQANVWADIALYWDASGVKLRAGNWNGITPPSITATTTATLPATTTNLFWYIAAFNGGAGTTTHSCKVDLVEIAGELATPLGFRGEELVTNF